MCGRYIGIWMSVYISFILIVLFTSFTVFNFWHWQVAEDERAFVVSVRPLLSKHFVVGHWNDLYVHSCAYMYMYIYMSARVCSVHRYIDLFFHIETTGGIFRHVRALVVSNLDVRSSCLAVRWGISLLQVAVNLVYFTPWEYVIFFSFFLTPVVFLMYNRSIYLCMCACVHMGMYRCMYVYDIC